MSCMAWGWEEGELLRRDGIGSLTQGWMGAGEWELQMLSTSELGWRGDRSFQRKVQYLWSERAPKGLWFFSLGQKVFLHNIFFSEPTTHSTLAPHSELGSCWSPDRCREESVCWDHHGLWQKGCFRLPRSKTWLIQAERQQWRMEIWIGTGLYPALGLEQSFYPFLLSLSIWIKEELVENELEEKKSETH